MQRSLLHRAVLAALVIAGAAIGSDCLGEDSIALRVMSFNMHHGEGTDGQLDLHRIASVINAAMPDLVALQEVDRNVRRTQVVDQPSELAKLTGMQVVFGANIRLQGGEYGNAILSRLPIAGHRNHLLPNVNQGEQRGVLEVEIAVPGGREPLLVYATHFDHRRDDTERVQSAEAVNALAARSSHPALLVGDLNDTFGSRTLCILARQWTPANLLELPTVPADGPTRQIDFILYRPQHRWKAVSTLVPDEAEASDHRAIISVLQLLPADARQGLPP